MLRRIKRCMLSICVIAGTVLVGSVPLQAATTGADHRTQRTTFILNDEIPASQSCTGEPILVTGTIEELTQTTVNPAGGYTITMHFTPHHLTAVGETSGMTYTAVGPQQVVIHTSPSGTSVFNVVNVIQAIGPGSVPNLTLIFVVHDTVNANGDVTASFFEVKGGCHG